MKVLQILSIASLLIFSSCSDDKDDVTQNPSEANLIIKFKFNPTQERLNNFGQPSIIPVGNAAQTPNLNRMSANYIELAPNALTALGTGEIIFEGSETTIGGSEAINFQNAQFAGNNEIFLSIPLSEVQVGNYDWVRVSLAYQEYYFH